MKEVSKEREKYRREIKHNSPGAYEVISSLRSQIETLQIEAYFLRDKLKGKNTLTKSWITRYTITIEHEERKTKELKNKSIIVEKNSINSNETSKTNNNIASNIFPVIDSIGFHVSKSVPENDTSESKNHALLSFPYDYKDLPT